MRTDGRNLRGKKKILLLYLMNSLFVAKGFLLSVSSSVQARTQRLTPMVHAPRFLFKYRGPGWNREVLIYTQRLWIMRRGSRSQTMALVHTQIQCRYNGTTRSHTVSLDPTKWLWFMHRGTRSHTEWLWLRHRGTGSWLSLLFLFVPLHLLIATQWPMLTGKNTWPSPLGVLGIVDWNPSALTRVVSV